MAYYESNEDSNGSSTVRFGHDIAVSIEHEGNGAEPNRVGIHHAWTLLQAIAVKNDIQKPDSINLRFGACARPEL